MTVSVNHSMNSLDIVVICWCGSLSRPGIFTDRHSALFRELKPLIALLSTHTVLLVCLVKQLNVSVKFLLSLQQNFTHTHTHTHTHMHTHSCSSSSFIVTLSLNRRTACARTQFSRCSSTTNAHSEMGQMAVSSQNVMLVVLSSHSMLSVLVGALFKKFGLFLNTPRILYIPHIMLRKLKEGNLSAQGGEKCVGSYRPSHGKLQLQHYMIYFHVTRIKV